MIVTLIPVLGPLYGNVSGQVLLRIVWFTVPRQTDALVEVKNLWLRSKNRGARQCFRVSAAVLYFVLFGGCTAG
jgi:hypothetical protein